MFTVAHKLLIQEVRVCEKIANFAELLELNTDCIYLYLSSNSIFFFFLSEKLPAGH